MKIIKNLTPQDAAALVSKLNSMSSKKVWGHSSTPLNGWYSLNKPTHPAGDGHWWTIFEKGAEARAFEYDGAWLVEFNEWYEKEAEI